MVEVSFCRHVAPHFVCSLIVRLNQFLVDYLADATDTKRPTNSDLWPNYFVGSTGSRILDSLTFLGDFRQPYRITVR
jgi:hypothetical protein